MSSICDEMMEDFFYLQNIFKNKINYVYYYTKSLINEILVSENDNIIDVFYYKQKVLNELKDTFLKKEWDII